MREAGPALVVPAAVPEVFFDGRQPSLGLVSPARPSRNVDAGEGLALDAYEVELRAGVLTNIDGIEALTAWRRTLAAVTTAVRPHRLLCLQGHSRIDP